MKCGIINSGNIEINNANIIITQLGSYKETYGIYNTGNVKLNGGKIYCDGYYCDARAICNVYGNVEINNGKIICVGYDDVYGVDNQGGNIEVNGGETIFLSYFVNNIERGISNLSGTVKINGGNIYKSSSGNGMAVYNSSELEITGGDIGQNISYGVYNSGNATIIGGTINGTTNGIYNTGRLTIGIKEDGIVNSESPKIKSNKYGIYSPTAQINFYDGRTEGGTRALEESTFIADYDITANQIWEEDEKIFYLSQEVMNIAQVQGGNAYTSIQEAIDSVGTEEATIEILIGKAYSNMDNPIVIDENQTITLDLKGNTITSTMEQPVIINNGNLKIIDSGRADTTKGKITSMFEKTIENNSGATLEINGATVSIMKNTGKVVYNNGTLNIKNRATIDSSNGNYGIYNALNSILNIQESTFLGKNGLNNEGNLFIESATFDLVGASLTNLGTTSITVITILAGCIKTLEDGLMTIQNITSSDLISNSNNAVMTIQNITSSDFISNIDNATMTIMYANINVVDTVSYAINNKSTNYIKIKGGTIRGKYYGILSENGTVIIGDKDGETSEEPEIIGNIYGICITLGTLNIYDGKIKGGNFAVGGYINEIEEQSEIIVSKDDTYETLTLQKIKNPFIQVENVTYTSLKDAINDTQDKGTITILRDGTIAELVEIISSKEITVDLNGHNVSTYTPINNKGNLKITDTSVDKNGKLYGYKDSPIYNSGKIELINGIIEGNTYGIYCNGTEESIIEIIGGTITSGHYGIYQESRKNIRC